MQGLIDSHFNTDEMTIPKGTTCTMFNDWNGGGSHSDTVTLQDVSIKELMRRGSHYFDIPRVYIDERGTSRGYSSDSVYGGHFSEEPALVA